MMNRKRNNSRLRSRTTHRMRLSTIRLSIRKNRPYTTTKQLNQTKQPTLQQKPKARKQQKKEIKIKTNKPLKPRTAAATMSLVLDS